MRDRLRRPGRHHRVDSKQSWPQWVWDHNVQATLSTAFQINAWPRHYANDEPPQGYWQMMNYVTGARMWTNHE